MGARPRYDSYGRVAGAELIPLNELKRPRIDVIMTLSGIFRDLLPLQSKMLAEASYLAATADEPLTHNFVRKHALSYAAEEGCEMEEAKTTIEAIPTRPAFEPAPVEAGGSSDNTVCDDTLPGVSFNGLARVYRQDASTDFSNFTFSWADGASNGGAYDDSTTPGSLLDVPGGTYSVTIFDITTKCDTTLSVTIADNSTPGKLLLVES